MTGMEVTVPLSGETLDLLAKSTGELAAVLVELRDAEGRVRDIKRQISEVIHERMDREACWTVRDGPLKITGRSPAPLVEWDVQGLMETLVGLVETGVIGHEAANRAIETVITHKVVGSGVKALMKLPGVAAKLEPFRRESEPTSRTVSVSRAT